jgi:hypothetical protein
VSIAWATTGLTPTDYEVWIGYVAGYLDGEGCFGADKNGTGVFVSVSNTYPKILLDLRTAFGGLVAQKPTKVRDRSAWYWRVHGENAIAVCSHVAPFLKEKREQAMILMDLYSFPPRSAMRAGLYSRLAQLKRIDYGRV